MDTTVGIEDKRFNFSQRKKNEELPIHIVLYSYTVLLAHYNHTCADYINYIFKHRL